MAEGVYIKGRKNGLWKKYYKDGAIRFQANYKNGRPNGSYFKNGSNGLLSEEGMFIERYQVGVYKRYNENGALTCVKFYNENGKEHGQIIYYFENFDGSDTSLHKQIEFYKLNGIIINTSFRYYYSGCKKEIIAYGDDGKALEILTYQNDCNLKDSSKQEVVV